jgi:hypothetical protein
MQWWKRQMEFVIFYCVDVGRLYILRWVTSAIWQVHIPPYRLHTYLGHSDGLNTWKACNLPRYRTVPVMMGQNVDTTSPNSAGQLASSYYSCR